MRPSKMQMHAAEILSSRSGVAIPGAARNDRHAMTAWIGSMISMIGERPTSAPSGTAEPATPGQKTRTCKACGCDVPVSEAHCTECGT